RGHNSIGESHYRDEFGRAKDGKIQTEFSLLENNKKGPGGKTSTEPTFISKPLEKYRNRDKTNQAVHGSNSLTIGSP
ncbi:MAG: hypothetical protein ACXWR0_11330, partial [Bdellovibrio sp.]